MLFARRFFPYFDFEVKRRVECRDPLERTIRSSTCLALMSCVWCDIDITLLRMMWSEVGDHRIRMKGKKQETKWKAIKVHKELKQSFTLDSRVLSGSFNG